jgi:uncharacterized cupin superfamily protein
MGCNNVVTAHVDAVTWEHDDETGGLVHMLHSDDAVEVGLWRPGATANTTIEVTLQARETLLVLSGNARLQVNGDPPCDLRPGNIVTLPRGARTRWVVDDAFSELWIYSDPVDHK